VSRNGIEVCCVDPSPLSTWPNNYGVWADEFESLGLVDCLNKTWPMTCHYIDEHKTRHLDRPFDLDKIVLMDWRDSHLGNEPYMRASNSRQASNIFVCHAI
jgi:hypothetical protein